MEKPQNNIDEELNSDEELESEEEEEEIDENVGKVIEMFRTGFLKYECFFANVYLFDRHLLIFVMVWEKREIVANLIF